MLCIKYAMYQVYIVTNFHGFWASNCCKEHLPCITGYMPNNNIIITGTIGSLPWDRIGLVSNRDNSNEAI